MTRICLYMDLNELHYVKVGFMGHKSRRIASHRRRVRARRARKTRRIDRASRAIKRARRRARVDGATTRHESMRTRDDDDFDESATRATTRDAASDDPTSPLGDDYERMLSDALAASLAATDAPVTKKIERWVRALGAAAADADDADDARDARSTRSSAKRASNSDARKTLDEMSRARDHGVQETAVDEEDLDADVDAGLRERDAARRLEKYGANDWTSGEDGDEDARGEEASARGADAGRARTRFARFLRAEIRNPTARVLATGAALELAQSFNARARDDPTFKRDDFVGIGSRERVGVARREGGRAAGESGVDGARGRSSDGDEIGDVARRRRALSRAGRHRHAHARVRGARGLRVVRTADAGFG